jgi:hypothetical protein
MQQPVGFERVEHNRCFDSLFMFVDMDEHIAPSSMNKHKKILKNKDVKSWLSGADENNINVYQFTKGHRNFLILCSQPFAGTGYGTNFYMWLLADINSGRTCGKMSLSKNRNSFYLKDDTFYFVELTFGDDFFTNKDEYFNKPPYSVSVATYILLESTFELEEITSYEIKSPCLYEE